MKKLKEILELASRKSEEWELFYMKSFVDKLTFEENEVESITSKQCEGTGLRVRKNGKPGFATSTKLSEDIVEKALEISEFGEKKDFKFAEKNINFSPENYINKELEELEILSLADRGEYITKKILEFNKRTNVIINFEKISEEVSLLTKGGFSGSYKKNRIWTDIRAGLIRKDDSFYTWQEYTGKIDEGKIIKDTLFEMENGMDTAHIESGKYEILFSPEMTRFFMFLFLNGIIGKAIFTKTSPLASKQGEEIFDERITIYDDGTIPGVFDSYPFDDEGSACEKTILVEKGILKNFLLDLEYGKELNMSPTGNSFRNDSIFFPWRSYKHYPVIGPSTMILEPGNVSASHLMSNIKTGLLIKDIRDFGNDPNGDFSGAGTRTYKIEKGKITGRVKSAKITGNIYDLFKEKLVEISSDVQYFKKFRLPFILFKDINITD